MGEELGMMMGFGQGFGLWGSGEQELGMEFGSEAMEEAGEGGEEGIREMGN